MKFNIKSAVCRIGLACAIALCTPYLSSCGDDGEDGPVPENEKMSQTFMGETRTWPETSPADICRATSVGLYRQCGSGNQGGYIGNFRCRFPGRNARSGRYDFPRNQVCSNRQCRKAYMRRSDTSYRRASFFRLPDFEFSGKMGS